MSQCIEEELKEFNDLVFAAHPAIGFAPSFMAFTDRPYRTILSIVIMYLKTAFSQGATTAAYFAPHFLEFLFPNFCISSLSSFREDVFDLAIDAFIQGDEKAIIEMRKISCHGQLSFDVFVRYNQNVVKALNEKGYSQMAAHFTNTYAAL